MCEVGLVQISDMKLNDYNSIIVTVNSLIFEIVIKPPRFEFVLIVMKQNHSLYQDSRNIHYELHSYIFCMIKTNLSGIFLSIAALNKPKAFRAVM